MANDFWPPVYEVPAGTALASGNKAEKHVLSHLKEDGWALVQRLN